MARKIKSELAEKIKFLRLKGYSVPEISKEVGVSKSTALRYVEGVEILPEFLSEWIAKRGGSRKRMLLKENQIYVETKFLIHSLSSKERLLFLSALYWGEGNKRDLALTNSDPNLIKIFISGMRNIFNISNDRIRANIRIHTDLNQAECLDFWSQIIGIPVSSFSKTEIIEGKKKGKLKYGMCRIRLLKGSDILKKIRSVNRLVFETFHIDNEMAYQ